jgi:hypothetical protein
MLEKLKYAAYAKHVNTEFHVHDDAAKPFALKLTQVVERTTSDRQEAFSLLFHGPATHFIPQGIHKLKHAELGEGEIFLVPVGKDKDGYEYEAVFDRLRQPKH